jgi:hypothetical protein
VLTTGAAITLAPVSLFKELLGDHKKLFAPIACKGVELPRQIVSLPKAEIIGALKTSTVINLLVVQLFASVFVTVYTVVAPGDTNGLLTLAALKPLAGSHAKLPTPNRMFDWVKQKLEEV